MGSSKVVNAKSTAGQPYTPLYLDRSGDLRPSVERELTNISHALNLMSEDIKKAATTGGSGSGGSFNGDMGNKKITNLGAGTNPGDAVNKAQLDAKTLTLPSNVVLTDSTQTISGAKTFSKRPVITDTVAPTNPNDVVTKAYVDTKAVAINTAADFNMTGKWSFGNTVTVIAPTADTNPTTKKYVDDADKLNIKLDSGATVQIVKSQISFDKPPVLSAAFDYTPATVSDLSLVTKAYVTSLLSGGIDGTKDQTINGQWTFTKTVISGAVPTTDNDLTNKKYVDDAISGAITGGNFTAMFGGFLGEVVWWHGDPNKIPENYIEAKGQLASRVDAKTKDLWDAVNSGAFPVVTEAEWMSSTDPAYANNKVANRTKYSSGDGATTFRLPDLNGKFTSPQYGNSTPGLFLRGGAVVGFGINSPSRAPNITGKFATTYSGTYAVLESMTGVFAGAGSASKILNAPTTAQQTVPARVSTADFNASRSSGVYGRDNTNEIAPNTAAGNWIICCRIPTSAANNIVTTDTTQTVDGAKTFTAPVKGVDPVADDEFVTKGFLASAGAGLKAVTTQVYGLYIGEVKWWNGTRNNIPANFKAADGTLESRTDPSTAQLWDAVNRGLFDSLPDVQWQASGDLTLPVKYRAKYSTGDGTTTFRLPDLNGYQPGSENALFLRGNSEKTTDAYEGPLGEVRSSMAPNISGGVQGRTIGTTGAVFGSPSGALRASIPATAVGHSMANATTGNILADRYIQLSLDASSSSGVYGRYSTNEVAPNAVNGIWIICTQLPETQFLDTTEDRVIDGQWTFTQPVKAPEPVEDNDVVTLEYFNSNKNSGGGSGSPSESGSDAFSIIKKTGDETGRLMLRNSSNGAYSFINGDLPNGLPYELQFNVKAPTSNNPTVFSLGTDGFINLDSGIRLNTANRMFHYNSTDKKWVWDNGTVAKNSIALSDDGDINLTPSSNQLNTLGVVNAEAEVKAQGGITLSYNLTPYDPAHRGDVYMRTWENRADTARPNQMKYEIFAYDKSKTLRSDLINFDFDVDKGGTAGAYGNTTLVTTINGSVRMNNGLELYGTIPYIDFHRNNDSADYNVRLFQQASDGVLGLKSKTASSTLQFEPSTGRGYFRVGSDGSARDSGYVRYWGESNKNPANTNAARVNVIQFGDDLNSNWHIYCQRITNNTSGGTINQFNVNGYINGVGLSISGGISCATISSSGAAAFKSLKVNGVSITKDSDLNLKKNIKLIKKPIEKVKQLNGVTFDWKESGESSGGYIAQDVQKVLPEAIHTNDNGYLSVDSTAVVGLLIEAVKSLTAKVESLEAEVKALKG